MTDKRLLLLVIDRKEATMGLFTSDGLVILRNLQGNVPRYHSKDGQSALRFERMIDIATEGFHSNVHAHLLNCLVATGLTIHDVVIGGPGPTKDSFASKYLPLTVQRYDVGYTDRHGLHELLGAMENDP